MAVKIRNVKSTLKSCQLLLAIKSGVITFTFLSLYTPLGQIKEDQQEYDDCFFAPRINKKLYELELELRSTLQQ